MPREPMGGKRAALDAELRMHSDIYLASENKCKNPQRARTCKKMSSGPQIVEGAVKVGVEQRRCCSSIQSDCTCSVPSHLLPGTKIMCAPSSPQAEHTPSKIKESGFSSDGCLM
ncbi:hypothetical protein AV530_011803 [Patagioenas fasciata monilis]|uniref:Uncharacterized protein n=1 Tax=Patagioenas fasciata monilis TaxID=372326 RepID=A0A1V4KLS8_PATFA|nr:hypothetical protein AV530_011803 [Patagioenas fasciata monilis]